MGAILETINKNLSIWQSVEQFQYFVFRLCSLHFLLLLVELWTIIIIQLMFLLVHLSDIHAHQSLIKYGFFVAYAMKIRGINLLDFRSNSRLTYPLYFVNT